MINVKHVYISSRKYGLVIFNVHNLQDDCSSFWVSNITFKKAREASKRDIYDLFLYALGHECGNNNGVKKYLCSFRNKTALEEKMKYLNARTFRGFASYRKENGKAFNYAIFTMKAKKYQRLRDKFYHEHFKKFNATLLNR